MLPEIYTLFITFLAVLAISISVYIIARFKAIHVKSLPYDKVAKWSIYGVIFAGITIVFALSSPLIFSGNLYIGNFSEADSNNASTFNGFVAPLVAIAAVITTGLAFFMQYQANQQVRDQFTLQQFETQFYEMIRLHRENLNEMKIEGYIFEKKRWKLIKEGKETAGKKIFITMINELEAIYTVVIKVYGDTYGFDNLKFSQDRFIVVDSKISEDLLLVAYKIFFGGLVLFGKEKQIKGFEDQFLKKIKEELNKIRDAHETKGVKEYNQYIEHFNNKKPNSTGGVTLRLSFNYRPFCGHQSRLAHYYRHLYMAVKYVVKQQDSLLSYEKKREYLRLLRAQFSNHEVVLLYYNWLTGYGDNWEEKNPDNRGSREKGNYFFTDYRVLHNLSPSLTLKEFDPEVIFNINYRTFRCEKNRGVDKDTLFELINMKDCNELIS